MKHLLLQCCISTNFITKASKGIRSFLLLLLFAGLAEYETTAQCNTVINCPSDTTLPLLMPSLLTSCQNFDGCVITTTAQRDHAFNAFGNGNPGCLADWEVASGTPSIFRNSDNFSSVTAYSGTQYALLGACGDFYPTQWGDGIVYKHTFSPGSTYTVTMRVRTAQTSASVFGSLDFVLLQSSLNYVYNTGVGCSTTPAIPATGVRIDSIVHSNSQIWTLVTITISNLSSSYNRFWIRPRADQNTTMHWCIDDFCVGDPGGPDVCLTQTAATSAFNTWLSKFSNSGGVNPVSSFSPVNPTAPSVCGGTTTVTYSVSSTGCANPSTCTKSFAVTQGAPLQLSCPQAVKLSACTDTNSIKSAYNTWKGSFTYSGGCDATTNIASIPALPSTISCGGKITFQYQVDDKCNKDLCISAGAKLYASYLLNGNVADSSGNKLNGTKVGTPKDTTNRFNQSGKALNFNGTTDYIDLPESFDYQERSVTAWFNFTGLPAGNGNMVYSSDNNNLQYGNTGIQVYNVGGAPTLRIGGANNFYQTPVQLNTWYYAAVVISTTYVKAYINGQLVSTMLNPSNVHSSSGATHAHIGCDRNHSGLAIGRIDDVRIYKGALTDCEIAETFPTSICQSTFEVDTAKFAIQCPQPVKLASCTDTAAIKTAYNAWKAGFTYSGACSPTTNIATIPALPSDIACGGKISFTYKVDDKCNTSGTECPTDQLTPYASYPLDGNALDTATNHLNGTITGTPTATTNRFGQANKALKFNGTTDYIVLPSAFDFTSRTVVAWMNASSIGSANGYNLVYTSDGTNIVNGLTNLSTYLDPALGKTIKYSVDQYNSSTVIDTGKWYQMAIVRTPTLVKFYVNGVVVATGANPNGLHSNNGTSTTSVVGADRGFLAKFVGKIDDIRIYNAALTDCDVAKNFTTSVCQSTFEVDPGPTAPLDAVCPGDTTLPMCTSSTDITAAYNAWKAKFTVTGGCNPSTNIATIPALPQNIACGGSVTFTFIANSTGGCAGTDQCTATFAVATANPVKATCPGDTTLPACTSLTDITAAYNAWKAKFNVTGGCRAQSNIATIPSLPQNIACGGSISFTLSASNITGGCSSSDQCTSTFAVAFGTALKANCPGDTTLPACSSSAAITAAYNAWKAKFNVAGGCSPTSNIANIPALPENITCGGSISFTLIATNGTGKCAATDQCTARFGVSTVSIPDATCPGDTTLPACTSLTDITAAYNAWKAKFGVVGGCNATSNIANIPALPQNISCGGSISFTLIANNGQGSCPGTDQCSATFAVTNATALKANCPGDTTLPRCTSITDITAAYNAWKAKFTTSGGCNPITNIANIPSLPQNISCGGNVSFTFIATNGTGRCAGTDQCTATFAVATGLMPQTTCPGDTTLPACTSSSDIVAAYNVWKGKFGMTGGCNPTSNIANIPALPENIACGGSISFTLIANNGTGRCAGTDQCSSTFAVANAPTLKAVCPGDTTLPACTSAADIAAAYEAWKAKFDATGGCNPTTNAANIPALPENIACGGAVSFTLIANNGEGFCAASDQCTARFAVSTSSTPDATCPGDTTLPSCTSAADILAAYNVWKSKFDVIGGCSPSSNILDIPALPENIACGGSISFTLIAINGGGDCPGRDECTASFSVANAADVELTCGQDVNIPACSSQTVINDAYTSFLASAFLASASNVGGCGSLTNDGAGKAPSKCGGSVDVTWSYTSTCGQTQTCTKKFTVIEPVLTCSSINGSCTSGNGSGTAVANFTCAQGAIYSWASGGTPVAGTGATLTVTTAGNYAVTATSASGCSMTCNTDVSVASCGTIWGCGPGYWKNHSVIWAQASDRVPTCLAPAIAGMGAGYSGNGTTASLVRTTFGVTSAQMTAAGLNPNLTLLQAVGSNGGGFQKLMRHGVTALLNSCGIAGHFPYTPQQILLAIHNAIVNKTPTPLADQLADANEANPEICPKANGTFTKMARLDADESAYPEALDAIKVIVFPNPSNSIVNLNMIFKEAKERVVLEIFNISGQKIAQLYNGSAERNFEYHVELNVSELPSGTYFYRLNTGDDNQMGKLSVVK